MNLVITINIIIANIIHFTTSSVLKYIDIAQIKSTQLVVADALTDDGISVDEAAGKGVSGTSHGELDAERDVVPAEYGEEEFADMRAEG